MGSVGSKVRESQNPYTTKLDDMDIDEIRDYVFEKLGVVKSNDDGYFNTVAESARLRREQEQLWEKYKELQKQQGISEEGQEAIKLGILSRREAELLFPSNNAIKKKMDDLMRDIESVDKRMSSLNDARQAMDKSREDLEMARIGYQKYTMPKETKNIDFSKIKGFALTGSGQRMLESEGSNAYISVMSPKEYLQRITYDIFATRENGSYMEKTLRINWANVKKYAKQMREGVKFDMPWLDYRDNGQEGRHRAIAALLNGYNEIPVAVRKKR